MTNEQAQAVAAIALEVELAEREAEDAVYGDGLLEAWLDAMKKALEGRNRITRALEKAEGLPERNLDDVSAPVGIYNQVWEELQSWQRLLQRDPTLADDTYVDNIRELLR